METTYKLKHFKTSKSQDLVRALKVYSDNIEHEYRTDTREILYWIDNYNSNSKDRFVVLGLYANDVLIGYTQFAYFSEEQFIEVDYLVVAKPYRKNNAFFEFIDKIAEFIKSLNVPYNYIICEVGCYFENREPTESSKTLIRLLKMSHFGVIKCAYYVPQLGRKNPESQMRAILMIYTDGEMKQMKKETYMMIINALLFKYYKRWYEPFFNDEENKSYVINLNELYIAIRNDLGNKKMIDINGFQNLLPLNISDFNENRSKKVIKLLSFIAIFSTALALFGSLAILVQKEYNIDAGNQFAILGAAVFIASLVSSWIFEKNSTIGKRLIEKLLDNV